jgi:hypothetical protein
MASLDRNHDANHSEHHLPGLLREDAMASMTLLVALLVSLATLHAVDAAQGRKAPLLPPPPQCTTSNPPKVPMRATIVDGDNAVQSDGLGEYVDNVSNANVETINAFALRTFKQWWPNSKPIRAILVDLNNPVPDGVGVPRGIFIDQRAVFAAFWYVDSNSHVHALQDIPIGITVESDRTQIWITSPVNRRRHVLHFGPWSNQCEPFGRIRTTGSTRVLITRTGANAYTFYAPPGSVATLSDVNDNNQQTPIYQGLFYVSFLVVASPR